MQLKSIYDMVPHSFYQVRGTYLSQTINLQGVFYQGSSKHNFCCKLVQSTDDRMVSLYLRDATKCDPNSGCPGGSYFKLYLQNDWAAFLNAKTSLNVSSEKQFQLLTGKSTGLAIGPYMYEVKPLVLDKEQDIAHYLDAAECLLSVSEIDNLRKCAGIVENTSTKGVASLINSFGPFPKYNASLSVVNKGKQDTVTSNGNNAAARNRTLDRQTIALLIHTIKIGLGKKELKTSQAFAESLQKLYQSNSISTELDSALKNFGVTTGSLLQKAGKSASKHVTVLGRKRVVHKRGRTSYVNYKGGLISLTEARRLERQAKNK
jgi:hypothetical protein